MTNFGLPVPPGFIVTTEARRAHLVSGGELPCGRWAMILASDWRTSSSR
jgi:pyruvate,orthophosphate dikinase